MSTTIRLCLLFACLLSLPRAFAGEAPTPAFLQPEVLRAALAINLTEAQQPLFRTALGDFVNGRTKAFNDLMRRNNQANLGRKMRSRTRSLLKQMDKDMRAFLTEEQVPAYEHYRETLEANLQGM